MYVSVCVGDLIYFKLEQAIIAKNLKIDYQYIYAGLSQIRLTKCFHCSRIYQMIMFFIMMYGCYGNFFCSLEFTNS